MRPLVGLALSIEVEGGRVLRGLRGHVPLA
jgi:hypothetical protein